ncbi:MAG: endonuclease/exonuclease/phosphatase family protein [Sphingobium sp.]|uniref:endonuclease/exonuclease/phosphatase family protein n=1 Tax=Sphingobium sp. TaxID=1912891 RepID=UPI003BB0F5F8
MSFLQIASWNIEHLGGASRADKRQSAYALADHIEMSGIDILVLQEIYVTPADQEVRLFDNQPVIQSHAEGEKRNADLDIVCHLLEEHLDDAQWRYVILPNRQAGDRSQLCAVMWDMTRVSLANMIRLPVQHQVDGDNLWDRAPHALNFTSDIKVWRRPEGGEWQQLEERRRLTLVPLHMKSNYGGVTENRRVRAREAVTLCEALAAVDAQLDPSLILIGDTNILANSEPAIETFIANGFVDLNNNDSATYWSAQFAEAPFDRAFVRKGRPEFRYSRQYVLRSSDLIAHDRFLSDHYMIKLSVKDYVDDADPR